MNDMKHWTTLAVTLSLVTAGTASTTPVEWRLRPYLWGTNLTGKARLGPLPTVASSRGIGDVLKNLNLGGMIAVEARQGRSFLLADVLYADVSERATYGPGLPGRIGTRTTTALLTAGTQLVDSPQARLEVLGGVRFWALRADVQATTPAPATLRVRRSDSWLDPQLGLRASTTLSSELSLTGTALVTPNADFSWDWSAELGWRLNPSSTLIVGYRSLSFDRTRTSHTLEATLQGVLLGIDLRF